MRSAPLPAVLLCLLLAYPSRAADLPVNDSWRRVIQLAPGTRLHIAADTHSTTCKLQSADETRLSCSGRHGRVFPRAAVRSVKLTRYPVSTLGGLGAGAGVGALVGVAVFRSNPKAIINDPGIGRAFTTVVGALGGAAIVGATDALRGPTIYVRPTP